MVLRTLIRFKSEDDESYNFMEGMNENIKIRI